MTPLKKYIRPAILRKMLGKAHAMLDQGVALAISYGGHVSLVEGTDSFDGFGVDDPGVTTRPLKFTGLRQGYLAIRLPGETDAAVAERAEKVLDFTAEALQDLMDLEQARRSIADEALARYRELALLHRSVPNINASLRLHDVVRGLLDECRLENYPGEYGMIFLREPDGQRYRLAVQFGFPFGTDLRPVTESVLFSEVIQSGRGEIVNDLSRDDRWNNELGCVSAMILIPVSSPNRCEGLLILGSDSPGVFEASHMRSLATLASVAGISVSNSFNFEGTQKLMSALLQALAEAIDARDPFTAGHSERVAHLAVAFAHAMNEDSGHDGAMFSEGEIREIYYAGILHDVGKIGIKEEVLTKTTRLSRRRMEVVRARLQLISQVEGFDWGPVYDRLCDLNRAMTPSAEELDFVREIGTRFLMKGDVRLPYLHDEELEPLLLTYGNLTKDERREIQRHPAESERILQHIPMQPDYTNLLTMIRQHHERMDGSGYPDGLKGDEILQQSRMLAIVDIYDAVTQERHYKPAYTRSEAIKILRGEMEEGKLDRGLTNFFLGNLERIETLSDRVKVTGSTHLASLSGMSSL